LCRIEAKQQKFEAKTNGNKQNEAKQPKQNEKEPKRFFRAGINIVEWLTKKSWVEG
jgi:hypothetical protein